MSFSEGWTATNLDMPRHIPRTEYSAGMHWDLIRAVTVIEVSLNSTQALKQLDISALMHTWNYDSFWNMLIDQDELGEEQSRPYPTFRTAPLDWRRFPLP